MSDLLQKELSIVISKIVNVLVVERSAVEVELVSWQTQKDSIEKLGRVTELKIRKIQIDRMQKEISKILKTSENLIILSTITPAEN